MLPPDRGPDEAHHGAPARRSRWARVALILLLVVTTSDETNTADANGCNAHEELCVNARDFLVDRARQCAGERGQMPNYLAVNFHDLGDLMGAVDTLNGVAP